MSDGPHRSLDMPPSWKKLAERADNKAYVPEEVSEALPEALKQDWHAEVPASVTSRSVTYLIVKTRCSAISEPSGLRPFVRKQPGTILPIHSWITRFRRPIGDSAALRH